MAKNKKDFPMSGKQVVDMLKEVEKRPHLIDDRQIKPNSRIEDIFDGNGAVIVFHDWGGKVGHWYAIVRNFDDVVYFFDSLGEHPDRYNTNIKKAILNSGKRLFYNDVKFQKDDSSCCGRHALLVCALNKMGMKPKEIESAFKSLENPDEFVINMIRPDDEKK